MSENPDAYKVATEAGREATKQLITVNGGILAGYLAFIGRKETENILDKEWAILVISLLFISIFLGTISFALSYLMHAARSRHLQGGKTSDFRQVMIWERSAIAVTLMAYGSLLAAIVTIIVTAYY